MERFKTGLKFRNFDEMQQFIKHIEDRKAEKVFEDLEKEIDKLYENALYVWSKSNAERDNKLYAMGQSDILSKFLTKRDGTIIKRLKERHLSTFAKGKRNIIADKREQSSPNKS